jgi:hypothetical protein
MKSFLNVHESDHLKACTLVNRTTEAKTVVLFSFSIDGAMNQIVHMLQRLITPHKTKVKIDQTGR